MKRILIATAVTMSLCNIAAAQTSAGSSTNGPSVSSTRTKSNTRKGKKGQATQINERKMYNWKDGQRATPTGHEATGTGGSAAPLPKDSARLLSDSTWRYR